MFCFVVFPLFLNIFSEGMVDNEAKAGEEMKAQLQNKTSELTN
jgi:hypothetical protein